MSSGRLVRGVLALDEDHLEAARAVDTLDPLELDVARRGRAADPGLGTGRLEARESLRNRANDLIHAHDAHMQVRKQAQHAAALVGAGIEDDRACLGDGDRAAGDDAVETVQVLIREWRVVDDSLEPDAPEPRSGEPDGRRDAPRRVGRQDRPDRRRQLRGACPVDGRPVVAHPLHE